MNSRSCGFKHGRERRLSYMLGVWIDSKMAKALSRTARKSRRTMSHIVREVLARELNINTTAPKARKEK